MKIPFIIEPDDLEQYIGNPDVLIIDLCKRTHYVSGHIAGAVCLDYSELVLGVKPAPGLLPDINKLNKALSAIGMTSEKHVIAYDNEGGGNASRLLWVLSELGHTSMSLLNGGIIAWSNEHHSIEAANVVVEATEYVAEYTGQAAVSIDYLLENMNKESICLVDSRSHAEFIGEKKYANRGGHIPRAVNLDWVETMDKDNNFRFLGRQLVQQKYTDLGVGKDQEVIVYCQTHHRSSHTYVLLKSLGYTNVKGYAGAWSEWGNRNDTPVEV
ncbi:MAG: sulfurtransferase [Methylococcales bacterium]|jgi:thiosulfate/3-mercaptopyruvate sulfurtransferase|nr:sulfurtransferase [Methylococcales bacterium]MBT7410408.1 sulfurtransferase [Methylococcales bacterium]